MEGCEELLGGVVLFDVVQGAEGLVRGLVLAGWRKPARGREAYHHGLAGYHQVFGDGEGKGGSARVARDGAAGVELAVDCFGGEGPGGTVAFVWG